MIRFHCDCCGKDISKKVHDSVKQSCGWSDFNQSPVPGNAEQSIGPLDLPPEPENAEEKIHLNVQVLRELTRLIHASAWGVRTTTIQCGSCAMEQLEEGHSKVVTFFTRVSTE